MRIFNDIDFDLRAVAISPMHNIIIPLFVAFCMGGLTLYFGAFVLRNFHIVGLETQYQYPIKTCTITMAGHIRGLCYRNKAVEEMVTKAIHRAKENGRKTLQMQDV